MQWMDISVGECPFKLTVQFLISGFRREVDENCTLESYYAACSADLMVQFVQILLSKPKITQKSFTSYH
jgi:hypothetical protein